MSESEEKITAAMESLGVKGNVKIRGIGLGRYEVHLNGEYFGIFDIDRNTFVD